MQTRLAKDRHVVKLQKYSQGYSGYNYDINQFIFEVFWLLSLSLFVFVSFCFCHCLSYRHSLFYFHCLLVDHVKSPGCSMFIYLPMIFSWYSSEGGCIWSPIKVFPSEACCRNLSLWCKRQQFGLNLVQKASSMKSFKTFQSTQLCTYAALLQVAHRGI